MPNANEIVSPDVFDNILAHLKFPCLTFGSGNNIVWMRILRVLRGERINYRELIKYARSSPTPMENSLKPMFDSP